jgi:hypothetical protein
MKNLLSLVLIGLVLVGCAPGSPAGEAAQPLAATRTPSGNPANSASGGGTDSQGTAAPGTSSRSLPLSVTVRPPSIPLEPVQGTPAPFPNAGWQTFTGAALGVAVDYPSDWSVAERSDGVAFTSPQGNTILLQATRAGEEKPADMQCASLMNAYAQIVDTCFDSASNRYSASLDLSSSGASTQRVTLSTLTKAALDVYKGMLNSLRPAR